MSFSTFKLNTDRPSLSENGFPMSVNHAPPTPQATPTAPDATPTMPKRSSSSRARGSFESDLASGYTLRWKSFENMESWLMKEEEKSTVEYSRKETRPSTDPMLWSKKFYYVCGRNFTGGKNKYQKKHAWTRKIPVKRTGCPHRLTVKTYPHTSEVLGKLSGQHSHEIGNQNARFTRLRKETRQEIERLLRLGVDPKKVLQQIQGTIYNEENLANLKAEGARRSEFCTRADVRRIEKMIEEETVRLASQDGPSVLKWVNVLRERGHYIEIKSTSDSPPSDSNLEKDSFVLIIQTKYQRECWKKHGHRYAGIDATHNSTHYENMSLFTLLVRDRWGHGMPAAWMISSNGTEDTINYFLKSIRAQNPSIIPEYFMSDRDQAQMNAIRRQYPESVLFLCWWHVLHAWQQHFVTSTYPDLWGLLKTWVRITDETKFWEQWRKIKMAAPPSIIQYLETFWLGDHIKLWSAVFWKDRTVFQACDTNMLVEAWHHLLKGTFMQGKRNRRLDHLIHILVEQAIPYFIHKHRRQEFGFEGGDLEVEARLGIEARSQSITLDHITPSSEEDNIYLVKSQSKPGLFYRVDLEAYDCECFSFGNICFCKHICAVQRLFAENCPLIPTSSLDISCKDSIDPDPDTDSGDDEVSERPPEFLTDINSLINKLSTLAIRLQKPGFIMPEDLIGNVEEIHENIDTLKHNLDRHEGSLPKIKKVAPNQHSWTETAAVMNVPVKSKKRRHNDPYSGGEQSGKRAKADARHGLTALDLATPANAVQGTTVPSTMMSAEVVQPLKTLNSVFSPSPLQLSSSEGVMALPIPSLQPVLNPSLQQDKENIPIVNLGTPTNVIGVAQGNFLPSQVPTGQSLVPGTQVFDPSTVNYRDLTVLSRLKRPQLNALCFHHRISAGGTNQALIFRLLQIPQ